MRDSQVLNENVFQLLQSLAIISFYLFTCVREFTMIVKHYFQIPPPPCLDKSQKVQKRISNLFALPAGLHGDTKSFFLSDTILIFAHTRDDLDKFNPSPRTLLFVSKYRCKSNGFIILIYVMLKMFVAKNNVDLKKL